MPQALLPMIPDGATQINDLISVVRQGEQWTYFCGVQPVFQHPEGDRRSFRMFTAQLCCQGVCTQAQILRIFGVSKNSVLRSVAKYRQEGIEGFYMTLHVILLLAYMALCRIKAVEQLQYETPGELGKMTRLPRRFVSRQRLCLRGTTDYWVDDALGQPFFSVERPIDHGLLEALRSDIVPRLLEDVPDQPTTEQLEADPYLSRFVVIFDREGYSPVFFREMWQEHRIACITYHKYPKAAWPESWFTETQVAMPAGEILSMKLAEMGSRIGDPSDGLWVREVRKLTSSGHQTSLISTAYGQLGLENAGQLFSRWSQENFFGYMMQHFAIDALNEYRTEVIPGTNRPVVNPAWRELDRQHRSVKSKLTQRQARFAALTLHPQARESDMQKWERRKSDLREEIEQLEQELSVLQDQKKSTSKHLAWEELPEDQKFERLAPSRKRLTDTVKLVAYRAETALAAIVREKISHVDEARSLIRDLLRSDADIYPDQSAGVLAVRLHTLANPRSNRAIQHLLDGCSYNMMFH